MNDENYTARKDFWTDYKQGMALCDMWVCGHVFVCANS